jgi:hypothetical protein
MASEQGGAMLRAIKSNKVKSNQPSLFQRQALDSAKAAAED